VKILAIETTDSTGSVALMEAGRLLTEAWLPQGRGSAQTLAPAIQAILAQAGWQPTDVQLVAVTHGPGSFTGLRVGVATAKTFAYAVEAEVLGVDTLEVIATGAPSDVQRLAVAVDAQRGEVVAGMFVRGPEGEFVLESPARLVEIDTWLAELPPGCVVSGPMVTKLEPRLPACVTPMAVAFRRPVAANVARLAFRRYAEGQRDDLWSLVPHYSRRSAAEETLDRAGGKSRVPQPRA
jgi:tRNA threonylcarbamoyladenosine biosynthesis protein TsaB